MPKDFKGVMHEWGQGKLHSGSKHGKVVTSQKQALAIAFSEQKKMSGATTKEHLNSHAHAHNKGR